MDLFVKQCEQAGIIFIGPNSNIIEQMGDKIAARNAMERAGVPVIPGTKEAISDSEEAIKDAKKIGYPIMLKAADVAVVLACKLFIPTTN